MASDFSKGFNCGFRGRTPCYQITIDTCAIAECCPCDCNCCKTGPCYCGTLLNYNGSGGAGWTPYTNYLQYKPYTFIHPCYSNTDPIPDPGGYYTTTDGQVWTNPSGYSFSLVPGTGWKLVPTYAGNCPFFFGPGWDDGTGLPTDGGYLWGTCIFPCGGGFTYNSNYQFSWTAVFIKKCTCLAANLQVEYSLNATDVSRPTFNSISGPGTTLGKCIIQIGTFGVDYTGQPMPYYAIIGGSGIGYMFYYNCCWFISNCDPTQSPNSGSECSGPYKGSWYNLYGPVGTYSKNVNAGQYGIAPVVSKTLSICNEYVVFVPKSDFKPQSASLGYKQVTFAMVEPEIIVPEPDIMVPPPFDWFKERNKPANKFRISTRKLNKKTRPIPPKIDRDP